MLDSTANIKILKNTIFLYIRMGITMLISFFTVRITLEVLGVEDYGLNNVVASVVSLASFINGSMGTAVQRFFSIEIGKKNEEALSKLFSTSLYLHIVVALFTLFISEVFAFFFLWKLNIPTERLFAAQIVFQFSILSMIFNVLNVPFAALLRAREDFTIIAIFDIVKSLLQIGVLYLLYTIDFDKLIVFSILNFSVSVMYVLSVTLISRKYKEISFLPLKDRVLIKKMLSFVSLMLLSVLASIISIQGVVLLINFYFDLTINASYAIAFQVLSVMESFTMNFKQSIVPQLMAAYGASDKGRMQKLMFLGTKITFLLLIFVSVPLIFESKFLLTSWLKKPPLYSGTFTSLLLIGLNVNTFSYFIYQAVHASGKIKKQQILISLSNLFSTGAIFLAFKLGANFFYAAYIPILFSVINNIIIILSAKETLDFDVKNFLSNIVGRSFVVTAILLGLIFMLNNVVEDSLFRFTIDLLISGSVAIVGGYFILLNNAERTSLNNLLLPYKLKFLR